MLKRKSVSAKPATATPSWLVTEKFTTGGLPTVTLVMVKFSEVEPAKGATPGPGAPGAPGAPLSPLPHPAKPIASRHPATTSLDHL